MTPPVKVPRKLIETALPLEALNAACVREKSIRHGHPSTLHLWWARRPLAAARAVLFAQMVNDPGFQRGGGFQYGRNKKAAAQERDRLFALLEDLVKWENTDNQDLLDRARKEILRSWREVCDLNRDHPQARELFDPNRLPPFHDPFAGGGSLPLEAQRLGLEAHAGDLNPVAVLINKAMIEIPPRFAGRAPVHPETRRDPRNATEEWRGAQGLAEDLRHYGAWMSQEAARRLGHLYPLVTVSPELAASRRDLQPYAGRTLRVVAWLWARTVPSPDPAFRDVAVPLASSFVLSTKEGRGAWVRPRVEGRSYRFEVLAGTPPEEARRGTKLGRGANFRCLLSGAPIPGDHIKAAGKAGRLGARLMAVVAEGDRERVYLPPTPEQEEAATRAQPGWKPDLLLPEEDARNFWTVHYGLCTYGDLFTPRQLAALGTFADLVEEARRRVHEDARASGLEEGDPLEAGGSGARALAEAVGMYLGLGVSRLADTNSSIASWTPQRDTLSHTFTRQAIPMTWDYAEANPVSDSAGSYASMLDWIARFLDPLVSVSPGHAATENAVDLSPQIPAVFSTDPPYYDNIGYADLSDFFYVWLRRTQGVVFPSLFRTRGTPKEKELVASPYRHGGKGAAEAFFREGMVRALEALARGAHPAFPVTLYYAFKQSESRGEEGTSSTGWETFLEAVRRAGFAVTGTWPLRTEREARTLSIGTNSLASSIVLVCRQRPEDAPVASRREFLRALRETLPEALEEMTRPGAEGRSPVAPVDLAQALIGPGMEVFTRYREVLEADGTPMSVRAALGLINRYLEGEEDYDPPTQWALRWFDQYAWGEGPFGEGDVLARSKATSVEALGASGILAGAGGKVRLLRPEEYPPDWDPRGDRRCSVWEVLHQVVRALEIQGEGAAARLLGEAQDWGDPARQLAYRLYTLCERRGWAQEARRYNDLVVAWDALTATGPETPQRQRTLFSGEA